MLSEYIQLVTDSSAVVRLLMTGAEPMRIARLFHSLRFKITAGITLTLLVILGAFSYLQFLRQRDLLLSNLDHSTTNLGNVIVGSLEHAMLSQDMPEVRNILVNIGKQQGIRDVFILNPSGVIRFSPDPNSLGTVLTKNDPGCVECHGPNVTQHSFSVIFTNPQGERVFRNCKPIANQPECQACHNKSDAYNGVLVTDLSMTAVDDLLATDLRTYLLWSALAIVGTTAVVNALMSRIVVTRLERLVNAMRQFSRGNVSLIMPSSEDELGDLARSFDRMADQVMQHTRELERLNEELRRKENLRGQLLAKLITAQEEERKRVARELHDQLGQALSAITMGMEAAEGALPPTQMALKERLLNAKEMAIRALEQTHELILDLRPVALDDWGLGAAMRSHAEQHLTPRGVEVQMVTQGTPRRIAPELEIALFRIVQEAINNIAAHADPQHVELALEFRDTSVRVVIRDDGCGFDPRQVFAEPNGRGFGLLGMQERAVLADGTFTLDSHPGAGTRIEIILPA